MGELLELSGNRQLFIDDRVIEEARGVEKVLHQPAKYGGNPVVRPSRPWEGQRINIYGTVMYEPDRDLYRMWYQGHSPSYAACYATSKDGIFWDKPSLGRIEWQGSKENSLFLDTATIPNVIKDHRERDPARLYKSLFFHNRLRYVSVAFSPDGECWTLYDGNPVIERASDTHTLLGWDEALGVYVAYPRPWMSAEEGDRRVRVIGRSVSDDFVNWTDPEVVLAADEDDPPGMELYGMPGFKYEGMYLGLPWAYHAYPEEPLVRRGATVDVQLASSTDGVSWHRAGNRTPFIPLGPPGSIDQACIYGAKEPLTVGDELWFYYGVSVGDHGDYRTGNICLAKLRLDGFISINAGATGGTLLTRLFRCDGGDLTVNASARGGSVSVAVLDENGVEIGGYAKIDCAVFDGDSVRHHVTWRDSVSLEPLKGSPVRLKFYMRSAGLYSFSLSPG